MSHTFTGDQKSWLEKHGVKDKGRTVYLDGERLEQALCTLADNEGPLKKLLVEKGFSESDHTHVCAMLRHLVDGWEDAEPEGKKPPSPFPEEMEGPGKLEKALERELGKTDSAEE